MGFGRVIGFVTSGVSTASALGAGAAYVSSPAVAAGLFSSGSAALGTISSFGAAMSAGAFAPLVTSMTAGIGVLGSTVGTILGGLGLAGTALAVATPIVAIGLAAVGAFIAAGLLQEVGKTLDVGINKLVGKIKSEPLFVKNKQNALAPGQAKFVSGGKSKEKTSEKNAPGEGKGQNSTIDYRKDHAEEYLKKKQAQKQTEKGDAFAMGH